MELENEPDLRAHLLELAYRSRGQAMPQPGVIAPAARPTVAGDTAERGAPTPVLRGNLPFPLTGFIGRRPERAEVGQLLRHGPNALPSRGISGPSASRLVTLIGPGGCGKTRLAIQVGWDVAESYGHSVWLVELASLANPALVPQAVATVLGVRESKGRGLQAAPALCILATSREPLRIAGEICYQVPPLSLPVGACLPPIDELLEYEAPQLFAERASAASPGFQLTVGNAPAIIEICRRLDGNPLAIELAATCVKVLAPEQIVARLDDRFRLLTGGERTALPRHQTLRAAIDWSHALLAEPERVVLRRLSVFAGGWTLEAAERVCAREGVEEVEVLDVLARLVNKSLVIVEEHGNGSGTRYRMLETIRQYAREKSLEAGEGVRDWHLTFFLEMAELAEPNLRRHEQLEWLARLDAEHDNLRAALEWGLNNSQASRADGALRIAASLRWFWQLRGHLTEGREWLRRALDRSQLVRTPYGRALLGLGAMEFRLQGAQGARPWIERAHTICIEAGDRWGAAESAAWLAHCFWLDGDFTGGEAYCAESLARFQALDDAWGIAYAKLRQCDLAFAQGQNARATELASASLALFRQVGDREGASYALSALSTFARFEGDYARAKALAEDCLPLSSALGDRAGIANHLENLGLVAVRQSDYLRATALLSEALRQCQELGLVEGTVYSQGVLGVVACFQGDYDRAVALQEDTLATARQGHDAVLIEWALAYLQTTELARGYLDRAAELAEEALTLQQQGVYLKFWRAETLHTLGRVALMQGDFVTADARLAEGLAVAREFNQKREKAMLLCSQGRLAVAWGAAAEARGHIRESLALRREMGARRGIAETFEVLAAVEAADPRSPRSPVFAARLLGAAEALREQIGAPIPPVERGEYEQAVARTHATLDGGQFEAAWADGRAMTWEQAAAYALET